MCFNVCGENKFDDLVKCVTSNVEMQSIFDKDIKIIS